MHERPLERAVPTFVVRRATPADAELLGAMRAASHAERYDNDPRQKSAFAGLCAAFFLRELSLPDPFLRAWVALESDESPRPLGTATLTLVPTLPRITEAGPLLDARVRNVYVVPEARRRGIALALMNVLMDEVRAAGIARLTLGASAMGRPLYQQLGFVAKEDEMVFEG
jgi:GNAT superfamily N-acetyltransferase